MLFINDAVSISLPNELMIVNWKEVVVAKLKLPSWNLPGGIEETHENVSHVSWCAGQYLKEAHAKYKSKVLPLGPTCFVSE
jgi:hypothetical protein